MTLEQQVVNLQQALNAKGHDLERQMKDNGSLEETIVCMKDQST